MSFKEIDVSTWTRREYFEHYLNRITCTYSITLNLDLTILLKELKKRNFKLYPAMIYLLSAVVNQHEEFRTAFNNQGNVGIFDLVHPSYTIFQKDSETFTNIWTEYTPSFSEFYKAYLLDVQNYENIKSFLAKPNMPSNCFTISSIPWVSFTGFNLNLPKVTDYLLPIFTTGKYFEQDGKIWLPIAIQAHHAVCDGFHTARLINELQEMMNILFQNT
ncbi:MAG: type A chloramphenicol O-acetyltransferase [Verrucomicrobia bacterium]|nr:type A chloramphenicol O-acetyltransferase [Verrucomicrobiota bacterium]